jgi:DNA-directed RNA polymerase subunit K/omega
MSLQTIPFRKIEEHTEDIFEAVTVIAKRARQIIGDRYIIEEERRREEENLEEIGGEEDMAPTYDAVEAEVDRETYEQKLKPTTMGLQEFLSGELKWEKQAMYADAGTTAEDQEETEAE